MNKPFTFALALAALAAGALWSAASGGYLAQFGSRPQATSASVTPVCNPTPLSEAELDGELPGGG